MEETGGARPLVLVVEDDIADWHLYGELLWYNGYDVLHAADGEEALQIAAERCPDLVLLDLVLPRMDGLEVCRRLKADPKTCDVPVVVLTGRSRGAMEAEARRAGVDRYIEKPASPVRVLHMVEELIGPPPDPS